MLSNLVKPFKPRVVELSVFLLSEIVIGYYAKCHYDERRIAFYWGKASNT
jgi:hypothetical protein